MNRKFIKRICYVMTILILSIGFLSIIAVHKQAQAAAVPNLAEQESPSENESIEKSESIKGNHQKNEALPHTERGSSLFTTLKQGGPVMIAICILALVSLTIIIERAYFFTKKDLWRDNWIIKGLHDAKIASKYRFREDASDSLYELYLYFRGQMERGLSLLSGIGSLSPIVGFLGTVIGMISAFAAIAGAETVNAKVVASGIQTALVTTAGGLIVAAPSLCAYYFLNHLVERRSVEAERAITSLTEYLPCLSDTIEVRDDEQQALRLERC